MILFWLAAPAFFLVLPYFFMRLACDMLHIRDKRARAGAYVLIVWALWQHFQLPPGQTGVGHYTAASADPVLR